MQLADCWKLYVQGGEKLERWGERNQIITFPEGLSSLPAVLEIVALYCQSNADITAFSYPFCHKFHLAKFHFENCCVYVPYVPCIWQSDTTQEAFFCHKSQEIRSPPYQVKSLKKKTEKREKCQLFVSSNVYRSVLVFTLLQHNNYQKNTFKLFWTLCFHNFIKRAKRKIQLFHFLC